MTSVMQNDNNQLSQLSPIVTKTARQREIEREIDNDLCPPPMPVLRPRRNPWPPSPSGFNRAGWVGSTREKANERLKKGRRGEKKKKRVNGFKPGIRGYYMSR